MNIKHMSFKYYHLLVYYQLTIIIFIKYHKRANHIHPLREYISSIARASQISFELLSCHNFFSKNEKKEIQLVICLDKIIL